jgi:alanine dehydrogenase
VKKLAAGGRHTITVQSGAGEAAFVPDADYQAAGAQISCSPADLYGQSDLVLKVRRPEPSELPLVRRGSALVGLLTPHEGVDTLAQTGVTAFARTAPRIRAPSRWTCLSQGNIAGQRRCSWPIRPLRADADDRGYNVGCRARQFGVAGPRHRHASAWRRHRSLDVRPAVKER